MALERLTTSDASGRPAPRLLERWSEDEGGLTWRLVLRPGLRYQDGTPLVAIDIKRLIDEARDEAPAQSLSVCAPDIRDVTVTGDRNVVIRLARRCAFLLEDLDTAVTKPSPTRGRPDIGTGPFAIASVTGDQIVLDANPHYYLGRPAIGRVVVKAYDTLRTAWVDMLRGDVDFLWEVGPETAEFLSDQSTLQVRSYPSYYAYTIVLNTAKPSLRSASVRRALNVGVDRQALLTQALNGQGREGIDPIWPSLWARDGSVDPWVHDRDEARRLLSAGSGNRDVRPSGPKHPQPRLTFTCLVPEGFTLFERLALLVQRQWRSVGIDMRLEAVQPDAYNRRIVTGDFDAALTSLVGGPYRTTYYQFWHSPGQSKRLNFWNYRDAAVDAALEQLREAPDDPSTKAAMRALRQAMHDNPPAVVLAWSDAMQAVSRRFEVPHDAAGRDALGSLSRMKVGRPETRR